MRAGDSKAARSTIRTLRRRPEVRAVALAARNRGLRGWIVGGAIRDARLGVPVPEIDVAVESDAENLALDLERAGWGRAVFLSRDRPGPRVFRVAGSRPVDLAEVEGGSIETDLKRRDFTVNAIAAALETGRILDPFGGCGDLELRRLRCVDPRNLVDDPVRAARAARIYATLGLKPDRGVLEAARRAAPGLRHAAAERVSGELSRLLGAAEAGPALAWAARAELMPALLGLRPGEARIRGAARAVRKLDGPATAGLAPAARRSLRLALLASCLEMPPSRTRRWLSERRWVRREADEAARLMVLAAAARSADGRAESWRWVLDAGPLARAALMLLSLQSPRQAARASRLRRLARKPVRRVAVTGSDVVAWLGIPPGPAVGALLSDLRVAAATGAVKTRREARHWLSGQVRRRRPPAIISAH